MDFGWKIKKKSISLITELVQNRWLFVSTNTAIIYEYFRKCKFCHVFSHRKFCLLDSRKIHIFLGCRPCMFLSKAVVAENYTKLLCECIHYTHTHQHQEHRCLARFFALFLFLCGYLYKIVLVEDRLANGEQRLESRSERIYVSPCIALQLYNIICFQPYVFNKIAMYLCLWSLKFT